MLIICVIMLVSFYAFFSRSPYFLRNMSMNILSKSQILLHLPCQCTYSITLGNVYLYWGEGTKNPIHHTVVGVESKIGIWDEVQTVGIGDRTVAPQGQHCVYTELYGIPTWQYLCLAKSIARGQGSMFVDSRLYFTLFSKVHSLFSINPFAILTRKPELGTEYCPITYSTSVLYIGWNVWHMQLIPLQYSARYISVKSHWPMIMRLHRPCAIFHFVWYA